MASFDVSDAAQALAAYRELTPEHALHTENLLLQAFAVLDRRMNKKALEKLAEFYHDTCFSAVDFVSYVKKKRGVSSIWFVKYAGFYPYVDTEYSGLFWYNF